MSSHPIVVPSIWRDLDLAALRGVILVIGAPDTGKSTFARWLYDRLAQTDPSSGFLDGDVGQSSLGPPTTLTLALQSQTMVDSKGFVHWFVGDVSPRGRMLPLVVGAGRLNRHAQQSGVTTVVVDTTGLVNRSQGGVALKHALVDELQPMTLFAFRRASELEPILAPLRRLPNLSVVELPVEDVVRRRDRETRRAHRVAAFRRYFAGAKVISLSLRGRAVFDGRVFAPRRLLALQDVAGFALALGVVVDWNEAGDEISICTPLTETNAVASVRLGAIGIDVGTGREYRPGGRA